MVSSTLNPGKILRDSLQRVGPVFVPVALLSLPGLLIPVLISNEMLAFLVNVAYAILIGPILGAAAIVLLNRCLTGHNADIGESLATAWRHAGSLIITTLLLLVILIPASMLLLIPGIYLSVRLFATQYAVILEHKSPTDALSASWELTRGRWWSIFGTLVTISLALAVLLVIASFILGSILPFETLITNCLALLITPPAIMAILMVYKVLKGQSFIGGEGVN